MYKVFIPTPLTGIRLVPFLAKEPQPGGRLFQDIPHEEYKDIFGEVNDIALADIVILPHEYADLAKFPEYLAAERIRARDAGKKILISAYQDSPEVVPVPEAIILRPSLYRSTMRPNEICMPAYVEDVGSLFGTTALPKGARISVGFAGKAGFATFKERLRYIVRNYVIRHGPGREGVYFRRRALARLRSDPRIDFNAVVRQRYSGHKNSIEVSPEEARRDYINSITSALTTLAPRGDGNYSLRFYETLSLGRTPILIDTDTVLPLEDRIPYDEFIIRIPWQKLDELPERLVAWFDEHSEDDISAMQQKARNTFSSQLYMPVFLRAFFTPDALGTYL